MNATDIIAELRRIRKEPTTRHSWSPETGVVRHKKPASLAVVMRRIETLEVELAGTAQEDFTCDILGYDTILSYLAKTNPEALSLIDEPIWGTQYDGIALSKSLRARGIPILKVAACKHMKRRIPKAKYVNAYPTTELANWFA